MNVKRTQDERRHEQGDVEDPILLVMEHRTSMTTAEITGAVKDRLARLPADRSRANKRDNESKLDQVIANALQERRRLCRDGLIARVGRGEFEITIECKDYLAKQRSDVQDASVIFDELFPDGID